MKQKPYRYFLYLGAELLILVAWIIPLCVLRALAHPFGLLIYWILPKERKRVEKHLKYAYENELSDAELNKIAKGVFINVTTVAFEFLKMFHKKTEKLLSLVEFAPEDRDRLYNLYESEGNPSGILLSTGHFTNWDLLGAVLQAHHKNLLAVARRIYYPQFDKLMMRLRNHVGFQTVYRDESARPILKALKSGMMVGILVDQDVDSIPGIHVNFFGKPAYSTVAIARFAMMTKSPIISIFLVREKGKYKVHLGKPHYAKENLSKEEEPEEIRRLTQICQSEIEEHIRKYPDQWVWMHNRWKTKEVA